MHISTYPGRGKSPYHGSAEKATGADRVSAEMLETEEMETPCILTDSFKEIWESEQIPGAWKTGLIAKSSKEGDSGKCTNGRGITLLPTARKVLCKIIHTRQMVSLDDHFRKEQAGFHFTLRQPLEQSKEWNAPSVCEFH